MRLFKPCYQKKGESRKKLNRWYLDFVDRTGHRQKCPAFQDKRLSEALGRKIDELIGISYSGEPLPLDMLQWVEGLPSDMVNRFVDWGLLPKEKAAAGDRLENHLTQWKQAISTKNTAKHAALIYSRVKRLFDGCGFAVWTQIDAAKVQAFLKELRKDTTIDTGQKDDNGAPVIEVKRGISAQTYNFYTQAASQFCKWMIQTGKAYANPLSYLPRLNVKTDRRHDRRALDTNEIQRLYGATIAAGARYGMDGHQRYLMYRLTIESGLRASEVRSLRAMDFNLDGLQLTVQAAYTKNRTAATLPLRKDTAKELRAYLRGLIPSATVFNMPRKNLVAFMLRDDLADAGIEYQDDSERFLDYHSLRHTTASLLAQSGAHPKVAQQIMRHSTVELTLGRYSHVYKGQESAAVEAMPAMEPVYIEAVATGTDGQNSISTGIYKTMHQEQDIQHYSGQMEPNTKGIETLDNKGNAAFSGVKHDRRRSDSNRRITVLQTVPGNSQEQNNNELTQSDSSGISTGISFLMQNHPELQQLVTAWPALSEPVRREILALVGLPLSK